MSNKCPPVVPLLHKTPFVLDDRPLHEATSPHAGLLNISRAYRSLGLPDLIDANLWLRKRQRGFSEAQLIESLCLLQALGGECHEDMHLLAGDDCLTRGLGYQPPKATAARQFLERFHDKEIEKQRPEREVQKSFIFPSSAPIAALQQVQSGLVRRIAKLYAQQGQALRIDVWDDGPGFDLKAIHPGHGLENLIARFFETDAVTSRFRPHHFPFTEPSAEMDIQCDRSGGELKIGQGTDWLEILGCGMVHPNVLKACGVDPDEYQGFAFGLGVDRLAMLKYGVPDLRDMFASDVRWLAHYGFSAFAAPNPASGLS